MGEEISNSNTGWTGRSSFYHLLNLSCLISNKTGGTKHIVLKVEIISTSSLFVFILTSVLKLKDIPQNRRLARNDGQHDTDALMIQDEDFAIISSNSLPYMYIKRNDSCSRKREHGLTLKASRKICSYGGTGWDRIWTCHYVNQSLLVDMIDSYIYLLLQVYSSQVRSLSSHSTEASNRIWNTSRPRKWRRLLIAKFKKISKGRSISHYTIYRN